jgi:hypothetical protein
MEDATAPPRTEEGGPAEDSPSTETASAPVVTGEPRPAQAPPARDEWSGPRRIALLVSIGTSIALFLGTAAALFGIAGTLPVAAVLALIAGLLEAPVVVLFAAGLERRIVPIAPLLLVSSGGGFVSYFVGGAVGVASPTTLGAGVLALVVYLYVGHRNPESRKRRVRRVRRWSRNAVVTGVVLLLLAVALYATYSSSSALAPVAQVQLTHSMLITQGTTGGGGSLIGASGDELYLLLGASATNLSVTGDLVNASGSPVANVSVSAGSFSTPNVVFLPLRGGGGTYYIQLEVPAALAGSSPVAVEVKWTAGDIPASTVALGASSVPSGWAGFVMLVVGITIWVVSRPPSSPVPLRPAPAAPEAPGSGGSESTSATSPEQPPSPLLEENPLGASSEGNKPPEDVSSSGTPEMSDVGTTGPPEGDGHTSNATSK